MWVWDISLKIIFFYSHQFTYKFHDFFHGWKLQHCSLELYFIYPLFCWGTSRYFFFSFWFLLIKQKWTRLNKCLYDILKYLLSICTKIVQSYHEVDWFWFLSTPKNHQTDFQEAVQVCTPSSSVWVFPYSKSTSEWAVICVMDLIHYDVWKMKSLVILILISQMIKDIDHFFKFSSHFHVPLLGITT